MNSLNSHSRPSDAKDTNHILHLYTPKVDKYAIQGAFLAPMPNGEAVYVTVNNPKSSIREFNSANLKLRIVEPEDLRDIKIGKDRKMSIIVDAGSFADKERIDRIEERERQINELIREYSVNCLCTYDVSKLDPDIIRQLATYHDNLRLTTSDLTVLSGDFIDKSKLSTDSLEKMVKDNLETIVLALLQKKAMSGTDMIETLHVEFNVLLSPGIVYPLLHSLREKGLLKFEKHGKVKTYTPAGEAEARIRSLLNERIQARNLLSYYLEQVTTT